MPRTRIGTYSSRSKSPIKSAPVELPPPIIQNRTNSIANVVLDGFAWGTGTSIAKNIFHNTEKDIIKNNDTQQKIELNEKDLWTKYNECVEKSNIDTKTCNDILGKNIN